MKKIFLMILFFILCGCTDGKTELDDILSNNNYVILDVRTNNEFNSGHVKDSINIPFDEIDENIEIDNNKTILVYCKSGKRSKIAYDTLTELGYNVYDLGAYDNISLDKE